MCRLLGRSRSAARREPSPLQLVLDHGADEYVLRPSAEDADVLVKLLARSRSATFDLERKVLVFANLTIE
jgi:hypothetical protein